MAIDLSKLISLLSVGKVRTLQTIVQELFQGGDVQDRAEAILRGKLDAQAGRTAGKSLGRAICEQIDTLAQVQSSVVSLEQSAQVSRELAKNVALQLTEAAALVLEYPEFAIEVAKLKKKGPTADLKVARTARDLMTDRIKKSLVDVGRASAGDKPKDL